MAETGVLGGPRRTKLIDGEIIEIAAIGSPHAAVTNRRVRAFATVVADGSTLMSVGGPLRLDAYNEPDVILLTPSTDDYRAAHPGAADGLLLVEVSEASLAYDHGVKLALHATFDVPEVWIVDLIGFAVEVHRDRRDGAYSARERVTGGRLSSMLASGATVEISGLLA